MKSLMLVKFTFLALSLLTSQSSIAMEITEKPEKPASPKSEIQVSTIPVPEPKSPTEITESYYKKNGNGTVLVPNSAFENTAERVRKSTYSWLKMYKSDPIANTANTKELIRAAQNGAQYLWLITQKTDQNDVIELAKKVSPNDVVDIIKYLYTQSCTIRPDKTGFTEGIIVIKADSACYPNLRLFLETYHARIMEGDKITNSSLIFEAGTAGAFRLMCTTPTEKSLEIAKFLGKWDDFHITIPPFKKNEKPGNIRIKPEHDLKVGLNKIRAKLHSTPNFGPEYNKTTDIPLGLIKKFQYTFPNAKLKYPTIGCMYNWIITELKTAQEEKKHSILECKSGFEKIAAVNGLSHLSDRTGSEIILGDEELFESYFSEKNCTEQTTGWKEARGIYLLFKQIRDTVRTYITEEKSLITENALRADIDNLYTVVNSKALESISEPKIRSYFYNTALTLKYLTTIKETPLPNTPMTTLKERLMAPVFEHAYQANLELTVIAEKIMVQQKTEKFEKLDKLLVEDITNFWNKQQEKFTKKYPVELPKNTSLGKLKINQNNDLFESQKDLFTKTSQPYLKLTQLTEDLEQFKQTHTLLKTYTQYMLGTAILGAQDTNDWNKNALKSNLELLYKELKTVVKDMAKTIENAGCYCSAGEEGKKIIVQTCTELFKNAQDKKDPKTITLFKKSTQVFASIGALQAATKERINQQKEFDTLFKDLK